MARPSIKFLFVGPGVCLRLTSDSASRRTPLPLANSSYYKALLRLFDLVITVSHALEVADLNHQVNAYSGLTQK